MRWREVERPEELVVQGRWSWRLPSVALLALGAACSRPSPDPKTPLAVDTLRPTMPEPSTPPVGTPFIADTAIGDCAVALRPPSEEQRAVIDALRRAYGLESALYRRTDSLTSWEQVYSHYRNGFSSPTIRGRRSRTACGQHTRRWWSRNRWVSWS